MTNGQVAQPGSTVGALARLRRTPAWLREFAFVVVVYVGYEFSRGVTKSTFSVATRNGWDILGWERAVNLDPEQILTKALVSFTPLAVAAAYFYSTMHYVITPIVLIWVYRSHKAGYRTARTALAISTLIGLVGFYLLPTAPPRLLAQAGIPDALFHVRHWGWWGGEGSVPRGLGSLTNQFAAMPSMHVGWALWCGYLIHRYAQRRWLRALGVVYPCVTTVVVLATGNHYLLDAVAGALVMGLGALSAVAANRAGSTLRVRWGHAHSTRRHERIESAVSPYPLVYQRFADEQHDGRPARGEDSDNAAVAVRRVVDRDGHAAACPTASR
ncbi:MAG: phosphatase PAP2 family protein [Jatrophihabitans sp.]